METTHNSGTRYISHSISGNAGNYALRRVAYITTHKPRLATGLRCFPTSYPTIFGEATHTHRHRPTTEKKRSPLRGLPPYVEPIGEQRNEDNSTRKRIQRPPLSYLRRIAQKPLDNAGHPAAPGRNMYRLCLRAEGISCLASRQPAGTHRGLENFRCACPTPGTDFARSRYVNNLKEQKHNNLGKTSLSKYYANQFELISGRRKSSDNTAYIPPFPNRLPATINGR